jgi:hypothetical protein
MAVVWRVFRVAGRGSVLSRGAVGCALDLGLVVPEFGEHVAGVLTE